MDEASLALVAAISAVVASAIGGVLALGGVIVQERLATRRQVRQSELDEARDAARRRLERRLATVMDTRQATDEIYTLLSTWAFATDAQLLRDAQSATGPARHPRKDWSYIDDEAAMFEMLKVTQAIKAAGRASSSWEQDAPRLHAAYNGLVNALVRQEDRLHDGATDLPGLTDKGVVAFIAWISIVDQLRMVE